MFGSLSFFSSEFRSTKQESPEFQGRLEVDSVAQTAKIEWILAHDYSQTYTRKETVEFRVTGSKTILQLKLMNSQRRISHQMMLNLTTQAGMTMVKSDTKPIGMPKQDPGE